MVARVTIKGGMVVFDMDNAVKHTHHSAHQHAAQYAHCNGKAVTGHAAGCKAA